MATIEPAKNTNKGRIPLLLELVFTVSQLFVLFAAILVAVISISAGNEVWKMVIHVSITVLVAGLMFWMAGRIVYKSFLEITLEKLKEKAEKEAEEAAERERLAAEEAARIAEQEAEARAAEEAAKLEEERREESEEENSIMFETELQL
ncbi:MAG: hypothetical protein WCI88_02230 [Chloroflexota bacterium]|jgi:hypothetical protein